MMELQNPKPVAMAEKTKGEEFPQMGTGG